MDQGEKAIKRVRRLELQHAISCLERACALLDDPVKKDLERLLNYARDTLELLVGATE